MEEESQPQSQSSSYGIDCRDARIIAKLRDSLSSQAPSINSSLIDRRVLELFNSFNTPSHPPYALMIQKAVTELNEENGSTEEAISEFIKKEFEDLPWAHTRILGLHLEKLCQDEELLCTESGRYKLMVDCGALGDKKETRWRGTKARKGRKKSKRGRYHRRGEKNKILKRNEGTERDNVFQEQEDGARNGLSELNGTATYEPSRLVEREDEGIEEQGEEHQQSIDMFEEQGKSEKGAQAQSEAEKPQNKSLDERIQEAIMELNDKIGSSEFMNTEPDMAREQQDVVIEKNSENGTLTQQTEVMTGIIEFCSDEKTNDENTNASLVDPTIVVIPREKLPILDQEAWKQNETHFRQQNFSDARELLVDREDLILHLETTYSSQPSAPDLSVDLTSDFLKHPVVPFSSESPHIPLAGIELTPTQLQVQMSKCGPSEIDLIQGGRLDEYNYKAFGDPEQHSLKPGQWGRQPMTKPVADYPVESLLPSDDGILNEQMPESNKIQKQKQLQPQGWGRGRGRSRGRGRGRPPKLCRNPHKLKEQLQLLDEALGPVSSPNIEPKETINSSQPALNLPVVVTPNRQHQLIDPNAEGTLGRIPSTKKESSSPIQLLLQMSWNRLMDGDLGTTSTMEASLSSVNVYEDNPQQHGNKGSAKRELDLDEKTSGDLEQQPAKCRRRGRPPKPKPVEDYSGVSLSPSDDVNHNEKMPNVHSIMTHRKLQPQRGRGRPRKLNRTNAHHCEELSLDSPQDQAQGQVHSGILQDDSNQIWDLKQLQLHGQAQSQGTHPELETSVDRSCQNQQFLSQGSSSRGRGRGRGRRQLQQLKTHEDCGSFPKPISNAHQSLLLLQPEETCQGHVRRLLRSNSTWTQTL